MSKNYLKYALPKHHHAKLNQKPKFRKSNLLHRSKIYYPNKSNSLHECPVPDCEHKELF